MSRIALLDVNVLVALFDRDHVHHESAHLWFEEQERSGWATCPLTENGMIRVLSNSAYASPPFRCADLRDRLETFCKSGSHSFWPDTISLCDSSLFVLSTSGPRHLTDIYLLGLAVKNGGTLATFDTAIAIKPVAGAKPENLTVIPVP